MDDKIKTIDYQKEFDEIKKRVVEADRFKETVNTLKNAVKLFREEEKETGISQLRLYAGYIFTYFLACSAPGEYIINQRYKMTIKDRRSLMNLHRWIELDDKYNKDILPEEGIVFFRKEKFAEIFQKYFGREFLYTSNATSNEINDFIDKHGKVFCKPVESSGGKGIFILTKENISEDLINSIKTEYLLEESIIQHHEMAEINPTSVNDIRIITAIDKKGTPHIVSAKIRAGNPGAIVDNSTSGGISYPLDEKIGIVCKEGTTDYHVKKYNKHPGSEKEMKGFKVPNYDKVVELVINAAKVLPSARWVGWDVAVRENDAILIEGNVTYPAGNMDDYYSKLGQYL